MSSFLLKKKSFNNILVLVNLPYPEKYIKYDRTADVIDVSIFSALLSEVTLFH